MWLSNNFGFLHAPLSNIRRVMRNACAWANLAWHRTCPKGIIVDEELGKIRNQCTGSDQRCLPSSLINSNMRQARCTALSVRHAVHLCTQPSG